MDIPYRRPDGSPCTRAEYVTAGKTTPGYRIQWTFTGKTTEEL